MKTSVGATLKRCFQWPNAYMHYYSLSNSLSGRADRLHIDPSFRPSQWAQMFTHVEPHCHPFEDCD